MKRVKDNAGSVLFVMFCFAFVFVLGFLAGQGSGTLEERHDWERKIAAAQYAAATKAAVTGEEE